MTAKLHQPVLRDKVIEALDIKPDGVYIDATFGRGGHSRAICERLNPSAGTLLAVDRDQDAINYGETLFGGDERVTLIHGEFAELVHLVNSVGVSKVDGVLLDLGVSSPQLDEAERGFSFMRDGDLDMRMDTTNRLSAQDWVMSAQESELITVFFKFGEERFARKIARAIIEYRKREPITRTLQLAKIIADAVPNGAYKKHPATKTFQAIRIHVNQELQQLELALPQAVRLLRAGGRIAVISFHSLEDRIVKRFIRSLSTPNLPPKNIPVAKETYQTPLRKVVNASKANSHEIEQNRRARSAVLRVAERTEVPMQAGALEAAFLRGPLR